MFVCFCLSLSVTHSLACSLAHSLTLSPSFSLSLKGIHWLTLLSDWCLLTTWREVNNSCQMAEVPSCRTFCSNSPNKYIWCLSVSWFLMGDMKATLHQTCHHRVFFPFRYWVNDLLLCLAEVHRCRRTWENVSGRLVQSSHVPFREPEPIREQNTVSDETLWDDSEKVSVSADTASVTHRRTHFRRNVLFNIHVFVWMGLRTELKCWPYYLQHHTCLTKPFMCVILRMDHDFLHRSNDWK